MYQANESALWRSHVHFALSDKKHQVKKFPDSTYGCEDKKGTELFQAELWYLK